MRAGAHPLVEDRVPDLGVLVKVFAEIRREADGVVRRYEEPFEWHGGSYPDYIWAEGNYSCDCNRHLFFQRAAGEPDGDDYPCGDELYTVRIVAGNGEVLYQDDRW